MPKAKLSFAQHDVLMWAAIGAAGLVAIYLVVKVVIPQLTKAVGNAAAGVANSVAQAPASIAHAAIGGADSFISEFTTPFSAWWKGLDTSAPAPKNAGALVTSGQTYYPASTGTNQDMGGQNFGAIDGALW